MVCATRQPFHPDGPFVVASGELVTNEGRLRRGDPFPAAGFTEIERRELWTFMSIDMAPELAPVASPASPADPAAADVDLSSLSPDELAELEAATAPPVASANTRVPAAAIATADPPRASNSARAGRRRS